MVVSGNHELSLDPTTWEEAANYMDQAGDPRQSPQQAIQKCSEIIFTNNRYLLGFVLKKIFFLVRLFYLKAFSTQMRSLLTNCIFLEDETVEVRATKYQIRTKSPQKNF